MLIIQSYLFAGILFVVAPLVSAEELAGQGEADRGRFVIAGFVAGREKLVSGEFLITGSVDRSQRAVYPVQGDVEIFSAFDHPTGRYRFDRLEPFWVRPQPDQPKVLGKAGGRLIRTPDATIVWSAGRPQAYLHPPDHPIDRVIAPFVARCVGATNWATLDRETSWEALVRIWNRPLHSVAEKTPGLVQIARFHPEAANGSIGHGLVFTFDTTRDYVPIAYEEYEVATSGNVSEWRRLVGRGRTEWVQIQDVWVPARLEEWAGPNLEESRTLRFEWRKVNEPVEDAPFTIDGLGAPPQTVFIDYRGPKPQKVFTSAYRREQEARRAPPPPPPPPPRSSWPWAAPLIWFNVLALVVIVWAARWKRRPRVKNGS